MNSLETMVLQHIGENTTSPDVFTDDSTGMAQIRTSLSHAIEDICLITGAVRRKYHIPLESGMNFYRIDNSRDYYGWAMSVWLVNQKRRLEQKDFRWLVYENPTFLKTSATPLYYCPVGEKTICLHPTPSSDEDLLQIDAVVIPAAYSLDTDRVKLRKSFKWAAVHYAVSEYWASRGDAAEATDQFVKFLEHLGVQHRYMESHERAWHYQTEKKQK